MLRELALGLTQMMTPCPQSKALVMQLCPILCDPMVYPQNSPGKNTGVDSHSLLQGIFLTQELNQGLLHCRYILFQPIYYVTAQVTHLQIQRM